jgi:hypothetical protein
VKIMTSCTDKSGKDESCKSGKDKSAAYEVGYGKPPVHTRFRKGQSGNPGGRTASTATERAKALLVEEACRTVTVSEGDRTLTLPAIQAVMRSQMSLALGGDFHAQQFILAAIQKLGR